MATALFVHSVLWCSHLLHWSTEGMSPLKPYRIHCNYIILWGYYNTIYNILGLGLQEYVDIGAFGTTPPLSSRCQWMRHSHGRWWMHSLDSVENSYLYELHKKFVLLDAHHCQPRMAQPHRWIDQRERTEESTGWIHSGTRNNHLYQPRWKRVQAKHNHE